MHFIVQWIIVAKRCEVSIYINDLSVVCAYLFASRYLVGQGIKFFEPIQDESLRFQYTESKGLNIWEKGQATLLKDVDGGIHTTTGAINANGRPDQIMRSIKWTETSYTGATTSNTYNGVLMLDEYDVDKIYPRITASITNKALTSNVATLTSSAAHGFAVGMEITVSGVDATFNGEYTITTVPTATTFTYAKTAADVASAAVSPAGTGVAEVIHFIDYISGTDYPVHAICDDGVYAFWVTNVLASGTPRLRVYKKLLTDDSSVSPTLMFSDNGITVTNAVMEYTKERIVMCVNDKVYEFSTTASAMPTAVYSHNDVDHIFTSITSSGAAIYVSGYYTELHYYFYPESITVAANERTWLGDNFDTVLLYASLVEAYTYMKGETDMMQLYNQKFMEALALAKRLGDGMERQDAYRSGQFRQKVT